MRLTTTPEAGTFTVTATDNESGLFSFDTFEQTADNQAPKAKIVESPSKTFSRSKARFTFDGPSDVDFFECKLDDGNFKECDSPKRYRVKRGKHTFRVRATDLSGNTGPSDSFDFRRTRR